MQAIKPDLSCAGAVKLKYIQSGSSTHTQAIKPSLLSDYCSINRGADFHPDLTSRPDHFWGLWGPFP